MAKHLNPREIRVIVECIRRWPEAKITWEAICAEADQLLGRRPARQTLCSQDEIMAAYQAKRDGLQRHGRRDPMPSSLAIAARRLARLQSELDELRNSFPRLMSVFSAASCRGNLTSHAKNCAAQVYEDPALDSQQQER